VWLPTGGGISPNNVPIPSWQQLPGVVNASNKGSTVLRNGPDISANANWTFYVCADQTTCTANEYGGTSFAAPMWAGYFALVNQQLAATGGSTVGFIIPTIYALGVSSSYGGTFTTLLAAHAAATRRFPVTICAPDGAVRRVV
jgi:subtilase family serine protease